MSVSVKICGLSTTKTLEAAIEAGADYAGFVFFERSPRNVSLKQAARLARLAGGRIKTVALTVNATDEAIREIEAKVHPGLSAASRRRDARTHRGNPRALACVHRQGDKDRLREGRYRRAPLRAFGRYSAVRREAFRRSRRAARRKRDRLRLDVGCQRLRSGQISCFPAGLTLIMCSTR